jgi:molybdenum ABC transporter molybdate-binding protein
MTPERPSWSSDWTVGVRVWVERHGQALLGKGRLELLEGIDRWRSISAAARQLGMSYRRAWLLVQSINEAAGTPLVEAAIGGHHGGGAGLTEHGRLAVRVFRDLQAKVHQAAAAALPRLVGDTGAASIHLSAAASLEEVLDQLLADHALQQPLLRVRAVFGASDELADHLLAGAPGDLFVSADSAPLDRLEQASLLESDSCTILAENRLAAIAAPTQMLPVRRMADLLGPEITRIALAGPASPLGRYTETYLRGQGLYEPLLPRVLFVDSARSVLAAVRARQAEVGLAYASDAASAPCTVLFHSRRSPRIRYTAAVVRCGQQSAAARTLLHFLASPSARRRFRACGFLPPRTAP